ncbi:MAG TPA: hypothetical protein VN698_05160, partial [Bacteroidia bacterium]|nr:hypothetical protein [Bacteroidia bacterium]
LYFAVLKEYKKGFNKYILLALLGAFSIFLSNVSIIILFTISVFLIIDQIKIQKKNYVYLAIPFITWGITFGFYYSKFIYHHPHQNGMAAYWGKSFMPLNIFQLSFWDFCFYKTKMVFGSLLSFGVFGMLPFLFFIIGTYQLIKTENKKLLFLLLFPTLLQLSLSAIKLYPFDLRLILFQTGFYIIIIGIGIMQILGLAAIKKQKKVSVCMYLILPLIVVIELFTNYPAKTEEIKNSIDFLQSNIQQNDTVYIYYGAIPAFTYYQKIGKILFKNPIVFGHGFRDSNPKYVAEIKNNKHSIWLLFSHIYNSESSYITSSLDSSYKKELSYKTKDSEIYLYKYKGQ